MYLDLVVILIIFIFGLIKYKKTSSYIYLFCTSDMVFRVLNFLTKQVKMGEINSYIDKYIPTSIYDVIVKYTEDTLETILIWAYVIIFIIFIYYTIQILMKKR